MSATLSSEQWCFPFVTVPCLFSHNLVRDSLRRQSCIGHCTLQIPLHQHECRCDHFEAIALDESLRIELPPIYQILRRVAEFTGFSFVLVPQRVGIETNRRAGIPVTTEDERVSGWMRLSVSSEPAQSAAVAIRANSNPSSRLTLGTYPRTWWAGIGAGPTQGEMVPASDTTTSPSVLTVACATNQWRTWPNRVSCRTVRSCGSQS